MRVTAETITDKQIRMLLSMATAEVGEVYAVKLKRHCLRALHGFGLSRTESLAYCAEIWNTIHDENEP